MTAFVWLLAFYGAWMVGQRIGQLITRSAHVLDAMEYVFDHITHVLKGAGGKE